MGSGHDDIMSDALIRPQAVPADVPRGACELTILMPCLNEAETLAICIAKAVGYLKRSGVNAWRPT